MKMKYKILFKSGVEEEITQEGTPQELAKIAETIYECFLENVGAVLTFGDAKNIGRFIRVSDVSQVQTEVLERDEK